MIIGVLQPGYLPWLGFFEQFYRSDIFVIYDDVQYDKHGWRNRNRIKTAQGPQWLTVPVIVDFHDRPLNLEVRINNKMNWRKKHLQSIKHSYSKSTFFDLYMPVFEEAFARDWEYLIDIDLYFIEKLLQCLNMPEKKIVRSSSLGVTGDRIERLIKICRLFHAEIFYEGTSGKNYIDEAAFSGQGIRVMYQDYRHPVYKQLYGDFVPYLSVIDLLFNHGRESLSILLNDNKEVAS